VLISQTAGGNVALAILLTVTSNLLAVATLPLLLPNVLAGGATQLLAATGSAASSLHLDPVTLLVQLLAMVLLPTVAGACARAFIPGALIKGPRHEKLSLKHWKPVKVKEEQAAHSKNFQTAFQYQF
jgi:sodium/bile acid cotransporter 7